MALQLKPSKITPNGTASSSIYGNQGCFFNRRDAPRCHISLKVDGKINALYNCTKSTTHALDDLNVCPLESRGWVLQECLLSPRTVHFTRERVFWDCYTKFVSESSPFDFNTAENSRATGSWLKEPLSIGNWDRIVVNYSGHRLTYESDRLIALAGIADQIQQQTEDEYFAGMWYNNLLAQLLWSLRGDRVDRRISPRRAPTWSWASVTSQVMVQPKFPTKFAFCKILKVEKTASNYQLGDMPNVVLWLSCPPSSLSQAIQPDTMALVRTLRGYFQLEFDCRVDY
ncbi:hypothetical protein BCON_0297g00100 [Botryotinia convoluta]|uniref:Heterokaryon incompatibility domain-containing protein n=1 Tax=Botryotinia convoluta TaxID=54673 RepID=A0A4Z1HE34_9HELO|nr:hypothetical protein BCON_0297g00100 [Botryotinia convoluta]